MSVTLAGTATSYLTRTTGLVDLNGRFTIMGWFKFSSANTVQTLWTSATDVASLSTASPQDYEFFGTVNAARNLYFERRQGVPPTGTFVTATGTTNLSTGVWYHIAYVVDYDNVTAYINGAQEFSSNYTAFGTSRPASAAEAIGYWWDTTGSHNLFAGDVFAFKAFSRKLTRAEIQRELSRVWPDVADPTLQTFLPLADGSILDCGGRGSNWQIGSAALAGSSNPPGLVYVDPALMMTWTALPLDLPTISVDPTTYSKFDPILTTGQTDGDVWIYSLSTGDGVSGTTGTASITEGADTLSGAGVATNGASAAITEGADALSGVGKSVSAGSAAITEGADTLAGVGKSVSAASAAITEANDSLSGAAGSSVSASAAITESADTLSGAGNIRILATAAITEGADTLAGAGNIVVLASAAITEAHDSLSGTGVVNNAVAGSASITEGADTLAGTGKSVSAASAAITEAHDSLAGVGGIVVKGLAAITEGADAPAGTATAGAAQGSASITEHGDSCLAVGVGTEDTRLGGVDKRGGWERWAKRQRKLEEEIRQASNAEIAQLVEAIQAEPDAPKLPPVVKPSGKIDYKAARGRYAERIADAVRRIEERKEQERRDEEDILLMLLAA